MRNRVFFWWWSAAVALSLAFLAPAQETQAGHRHGWQRRAANRIIRNSRLRRQDVVPKVPGRYRPQGGVSAFATGTGIPDPSAAANRISSYGGVPNDGLDDSAAIIACRRAVIAAGTYEIIVDGFYDVVTVAGVSGINVLHPTADGDGTHSGTRPTYGIHFVGTAQNYSGFILHRDAGDPNWLYDSSVEDGWNRVQFSNLWFKTDMPNVEVGGAWNATWAADVNGFKEAARLATGVDKGFTYTNCRFNGFGTPYQWTGESNTDSSNFYSSWWHNCGPLILENDQTLCHNFTSCHLWYPTDCFWLKNTAGMGQQLKGGAGAINLYNCDIISEAFGTTITPIANNGSGLIRVTAASHGYNTNDFVVISGAASATGASNRWQVTRIDANTVDLIGSTFAATGTTGVLSQGTTPYYTLRIDDGAAFARAWTFRDCRWELRQTYLSRLLHKRGDSSFTFTNEVLFDGCDLSVNHGGESGATGREYLTLGGYTYVHFADCHINERWGTGFYDVASASVVGGQYQPLVVYDHCAFGPTFVQNLATRITYDSGSTNPGSFGRVISNGGRALTSTLLSANHAFDFDYGNTRGGRGEPARVRKRLSFKAPTGVWPTLASGVGTAERTVTLPAGSRILAVGLDRPAASTSVTLTQYRIGSDDKTITYCASGPIRADGHHRARSDESTEPSLFPISVGTDANLMTLRLWLGPVESSLTTTGGDAWVEFE